MNVASTQAPCTIHKDCTAVTWATDKGATVGTSHLHVWLDKPGTPALDGRNPTDMVFGQLVVGVYKGLDSKGNPEFDPNLTVLSASFPAIPDDNTNPGGRLNNVYPVADDHRQPQNKDGTYPKLDPTAPTPAQMVSAADSSTTTASPT